MLLLTLALPPPSNLRVSALGSTSLQVEWGVVPDAVGYEISYTPSLGACEGVEGGTVGVSGGGATSHALQGLEEFTEYLIAIRTVGPDGVGAPSALESHKTLHGGECSWYCAVCREFCL